MFANANGNIITGLRIEVPFPFSSTAKRNLSVNCREQASRHDRKALPRREKKIERQGVLNGGTRPVIARNRKAGGFAGGMRQRARCWGRKIIKGEPFGRYGNRRSRISSGRHHAD